MDVLKAFEYNFMYQTTGTQEFLITGSGASVLFCDIIYVIGKWGRCIGNEP